MAPASLHMGMEVRTKVWMEQDGQVMLSDWRVALLEAVEATGSLAAAARRLDVPYRTAWQKLHALEGRWGFAFLVTESGGPDGGRSRLTPQARALIARFHQVVAGLQEQTEMRFTTLFADDVA
ncbi:MAG TPA: LysR family transcriptional regulator [Chloroflexia bacterium]|nr:LysR family transcriptional regulator [Chloroflexia bacterium]